MAEKRNVIILKSFDLDYLMQVKDFIHRVAPHIDRGIYSEPLRDWEKMLRPYEFRTVEWYDDYSFLYYGHGAKTGDRIFELAGSMSLGEL